ncbi:MAG: PAS domain S-box-containing protein [Myxococcota bacterium]|jgi:PAS domain S-box-containing protein
MRRDGKRESVTPKTFQALIQRAPDFIFLINRQFQIVYLNHSLPSLPMDDVLGQTADKFVEPQDRAKVLAAIKAVFETREPQTYETTGPGGEDGPSYYITRVGWVPVEEGPELVSVISTDITKRKQAEARAVVERQFLDAMNRINRVIVDSETIDAMLEDCLELMLDIFGCDRAWLLLPCDPDAPSWSIEMERTRRDWPGASELKEPQPMSDFSRFVFQTALSADGAHRFDPNHQPLDPGLDLVKVFGMRSQMLMAIYPRVGEAWCLGIHHCEEARIYSWEVPLFESIGRRLADGLTSLLIQRDLRSSEERFRTLVEHAPEAIVVFDVDRSTLTFANRKAQELLGHRAVQDAEPDIAAINPLLQPDGQPSRYLLEERLAEALAGGTPDFEWSFVHVTGAARPCEVHLVRLPSENRRVVRASITDIRARRAGAEEKARLQELLVQAQKMEAIGQLTGGLAHDFNNLLTVILGHIELAGIRSAAGEPTADILGPIEEAAKRAAALTHRLLAFSRKQALSPSLLSLNVLLNGIEEMLQRTLGETVAVVLQCAEGLWSCEMDASQLENAILNLSINARDAMPEGGRLSLQTANLQLYTERVSTDGTIPAGEYVLLTVIDEGVGIPPDVLARVFEPFFTTKAPGQGSGLGLSMVFGFVKQSGGYIALSSTPGQGTVVNIYLPRADTKPPVSAAAARLTRAPTGRGELVLVVEDEESVRSLTVRFFALIGYTTVDVEDGQRALEVLETEPSIALLFTDVVLPGGMNGAELADAAQRLRPGLPILFTSGYASDAMTKDGRLQPGVELLEKPYSVTTLADRIHRLLHPPR